MENAKGDGKTIIIYFGASWCSPCKTIAKNVFSTSEFIAYSKKFEMVKIYDDFNRDEKTKYNYYGKICSQFQIASIPSFVVIKKNGKPCSISGAYYKPEVLIKALNSCN